MTNHDQFYIGGKWVKPGNRERLDVTNPATEEAVATISLGTQEDVDRAVLAARTAFETFSQTSLEQRLDLLDAIATAYKRRRGEMAETISREMGAPATLAQKAHAPAGLGHIIAMIDVLNSLFKEPNICFEDGQTVWRALNDYRQAKPVKVGNKKKEADFPDALIVNKAKFCAMEKGDVLDGVYTFDIAAQIIPGTASP